MYTAKNLHSLKSLTNAVIVDQLHNRDKQNCPKILESSIQVKLLTYIKNLNQ